MAYRDDVTAAVQQMATDIRKMRDKVDDLLAAPGESVRAEVGETLRALEQVRLALAMAQGSCSHPGIKGGLGTFERAGLVPRIPSDDEKEREARAAKATGPAVVQVDEYTRTVKRRECNCEVRYAFWAKGRAADPLDHARDCPMHPSQLERTLRETGALPDAVPETDFNRAAPRPSGKEHLP